jgi:hypothetical protein
MKAVLIVLLILPGGFFLVPALLLLRRRWLRNQTPQVVQRISMVPPRPSTAGNRPSLPATATA